MGDHTTHVYVLRAARFTLLPATLFLGALQLQFIELNDPELAVMLLSYQVQVYSAYATVETVLTTGDVLDAVVKSVRRVMKKFGIP